MGNIVGVVGCGVLMVVVVVVDQLCMPGRVELNPLLETEQWGLVSANNRQQGLDSSMGDLLGLGWGFC
jgi:hypothetical protein